jgi:penicillin-binding protein 1C
MQVIRLSRGRERTLWQKFVEAFKATRLELRYSKRRILALYASNAPFGGNVVGLDAAAWRYFGRPPEELSWAEAATLAVLPNAPSAIHMGRGREELMAKRNRLLSRLLEHGDITLETYESALEEPLPGEPLPLPSYAFHFVEGAPKGVRTRSSLIFHLQLAVEEAVRRRSDALAAEGVADMAAVVMDNATGEVVAYVGNSSLERERPGRQVDIASAPRSTGSILKPFLYAGALSAGVILPRTLLPDVPVNLGGFAPQNFDRQFYGAVHSDEALARSLNVPSVFLLRKYGVERFYGDLKALGLTTLTQPAGHYGLALILGGAEGRLTEITAAYSGLVGASVRKNGQKSGWEVGQVPLWYTFEALKEVNRPDQLDWRLIGSVRKAAWKTGTSYGFRDAWAVGMTPRYTIGVWAGNAEGAGVPGLTGARAAGPAMFDILNLLPADDSWFPQPDGGIFADVCVQSGHLAGPDCPEIVSMQLPESALESETCPYHHGGAFTLPPTMEWYYRPHHPEYTPPRAAEKVMEFIYPGPAAAITLPHLSGGEEGAVFRVAHRRQGATLWWHLDGTIVGETTLVHSLRLAPAPGSHVLTVVDDEGETATVTFTVL